MNSSGKSISVYVRLMFPMGFENLYDADDEPEPAAASDLDRNPSWTMNSRQSLRVGMGRDICVAPNVNHLFSFQNILPRARPRADLNYARERWICCNRAE
jgi:hypothetical protein